MCLMSVSAFSQEELSGMKNRIQVVVLDNERLQQELKARRPEEAMREQTLLDASVSIFKNHNCILVWVFPPISSPAFGTGSVFSLKFGKRTLLTFAWGLRH